MTTRTRWVALALALPLLAGCTGAEEPPVPAATTEAGAEVDAGPQPGDEVDIDAFYDRAQAAAEQAGTYAMTMTMTDGAGETTSMNGHGDISDPHHPRADMRMTLPGGTGQVHVILDGASAFVQPPMGGAGYLEMPVEAFVQPDGQNLTSLMKPAEMMAFTRAAVVSVIYQGVEEEGGESLHHYSVIMDPQKLEQTYTTQQPGVVTMPTTIPYEIWLDDQHLLRKMTMDAQDSSMTMTADRYGQPVEITVPPSEQIEQFPAPAQPGAPEEPDAPEPPPTS
ncbi:MAG: hypothetical protein Q4G43_05810 [Mobilicoccus sp.]|nr:hypothetical protein [Mobilicoccus sp.]